jgi:probable phosphoglycerate mutase
MTSLTRICLVRHGETEWNVARRLQGQIDINLNALGVRQAEAAANWLVQEPIAALYSSDLKRARTTAEHIARHLHLPLTLVPEVRERRYGIFEGLTYDEARAQHPEAYARFEARDPDYAFANGGESLLGFSARVSTRLQEIVACHPGEMVVIVTHGGVLDVVNRFVRNVPLDAPRDFLIPNAGLNWVNHLDGEWRIEAWGQIAHLEATALDEL